MPPVVIADIIGSRRLLDRQNAQRDFDDAITRVQDAAPLATVPLRPTVGDEQQGMYPRLDAALASLLLLQLALPDGLQFRFGVGVGDVRTVETADNPLSDGPGWWAAREAIDIVHRRQRRTAPFARTWIVAAAEEDDSMHRLVRFANAQVTLRDRLVTGMSARQRRLTYGRCLGVTQRDLAEREEIAQSAVSQALTSSGGQAVAETFAMLTTEGVSR